MKKILYLHAGAELYGADIVLLELLKNLDKNKFRPYVILPCYGPLVDKLKENNIEVEVIHYPILRRKYFTPVGVIKYMISYIKCSLRMVNIAKSKRIDIVHTNTAAVLEGIFIKKKLKIPQIWHIHEIIVKPRIIHKILSFLISKYSNEVVTVSNAVRKHLYDTGYFKNNIRVIYNGVDNKIFKSNNEIDYIKKEFNIEKNAIIVGMIGRINRWKGQSDFLKAMDIVLKENKNVYGMLVGGVFDGEEWRKEEIKRQINSMENKDRIIFSDYRTDTPNIHSLYDVFVLPSINPDPLPTVVLEAMASTKPIIGYKHGGICEMVKDGYNGFLAEVMNPTDLAQKIKLVLKDDIRKEMGKKSEERQKEKFSLKSYVRNFSLLYNEVGIISGKSK